MSCIDTSFVAALLILLLCAELTLEADLAENSPNQRGGVGRKRSYAACLSNCIRNGNAGSSYKNVLLGLPTYHQFCIIKCYAFLA